MAALQRAGKGFPEGAYISMGIAHIGDKAGNFDRGWEHLQHSRVDSRNCILIKVQKSVNIETV